MKENLAKRLIFISRIIVGVLIIMIPVFMLKQEENDLRLDVESFSIISQANEVQPDKFAGNPFNERVLVWLKSEHKELYDKNISLRQLLTNWLLENNLTTQDEIGRIKNNDEDTGFILLSYELTDTDQQILSETPWDVSSVGKHLEYFDVLSVPRSLHIATKLTGELPDISNRPEFQEVNFDQLFLEGNEAVLRFRFLNYVRQAEPPYLILTVETEQVDAPAILTFVQGNTINEDNNQEEIIANTVATVKSDRKRLDAVYANVPLYLATQIASERLVSVYSTVDILGFSLARKNLPWGILIIMITLLGASIITLKTALSHSLKIVSEVVSEDAFDILLDSMIGRVAIWIIVPLLAIVASLPTSPLTEIEIILLIVGGLISLLLGYRCVLLSNKL